MCTPRIASSSTVTGKDHTPWPFIPGYHLKWHTPQQPDCGSVGYRKQGISSKWPRGIYILPRDNNLSVDPLPSKESDILCVYHHWSRNGLSRIINDMVGTSGGTFLFTLNIPTFLNYTDPSSHPMDEREASWTDGLHHKIIHAGLMLPHNPQKTLTSTYTQRIEFHSTWMPFSLYVSLGSYIHASYFIIVVHV